MALSSSSKENISLKKLVGKAHTSNSLEAFNESKSTGLTLSTSSIFAETIKEAVLVSKCTHSSPFLQD